MDSLRRWAAVALAALSLVYLLGSFIDPPLLRPLMRISCHRLPHRSFHFPWGAGGQCARCTGFWSGTLIFSVLLLFRKPPGTIAMGFLLLLPMAIDGSWQYFGRYESSNLIRVVTGAAAGSGLAMLLGKATGDQ